MLSSPLRHLENRSGRSKRSIDRSGTRSSEDCTEGMEKGRSAMSFRTIASSQAPLKEKLIFMNVGKKLSVSCIERPRDFASLQSADTQCGADDRDMLVSCFSF